MGAKCVYCMQMIIDDRAVDICDVCGNGVWGKMFVAVKENCKNAQEKGNLYQGSITRQR